MPRPGDTIHIPLPFEDTIAAVLKVKPPPKTPKSKAKAQAAPKREDTKQAGKN